MFCSKCGKEKNETDKFCPSCGHTASNNVHYNTNQNQGNDFSKFIWITVIIIAVIIIANIPTGSCGMFCRQRHTVFQALTGNNKCQNPLMNPFDK